VTLRAELRSVHSKLQSSFLILSRVNVCICVKGMITNYTMCLWSRRNISYMPYLKGPLHDDPDLMRPDTRDDPCFSDISDRSFSNTPACKALQGAIA